MEKKKKSVHNNTDNTNDNDDDDDDDDDKQRLNEKLEFIFYFMETLYFPWFNKQCSPISHITIIKIFLHLFFFTNSFYYCKVPCRKKKRTKTKKNAFFVSILLKISK